MPYRIPLNSDELRPPSPWGRVGDGGSAVSGRGFISAGEHPSPAPFPLGKGSLVARNRNLLCNHLQHPVDIRQHLIVPEADHAVAVGFDNSRAVRVSLAFGMLPAIELDDDPQTSAGEVCDEIAYRKLPRELHSLKIAVAQMQPQLLFRFGRFLAQFAREAGQSLFRHRGKPIPNPFPQGKGLIAAKLS